MARAGLTPDRIAVAAADLADEIGFDAVTVTALARGFGVKDASLYSHVKNVQDLRARVALLSATEFADRLAAAVAGRAHEQALYGFADAYRAFAVTHPGRYAAVQLPLLPDLAATSPGHRRLIEITTAVLRAYDLPEPDATDAVRLLRSTFHGFTVLESTASFHLPRPLNATWPQLLRALHLTLTTWPPATP
ncbi:TetR-like C-terminal domain-containing protein [Actinocorallia lasiicapitis]